MIGSGEAKDYCRVERMWEQEGATVRASYKAAARFAVPRGLLAYN